MMACPPPPPPVEPILLGAPLPTAFLYGWTAERALRLAVEEINAAGGVNVGGVMRPFELVVMDTRDLEPGVPTSDVLLTVEKLILDEGAHFIVGGPARSEAALAAMDIQAEHKRVTIVSTGVLSPAYHARVANATADGLRYNFRISSHAGWLIMGEMVPFLEEVGEKFGLNRMFIMVQDVAHARAAGTIIEGAMRARNWTITGHEVFPTGTTDFSLALLDAKAAGRGVLLIWMDMPESAILLSQWYDMEVPLLPVGFISAAEEPGFWDATDGAAAYTTVTVVNAGNAPSEATPWTMQFVNAYKQRWGLEPEGYGAASSYMVPYVLKDAIERAGTLEPDAVVAALRATDLMGVYGRIRFNPVNNQIIPSLDPEEGAVGTIFQWQAGERVVVFPPIIAGGEVELPPWM
jgi:branched-chain amino acid transport system substrate-binding protein